MIALHGEWAAVDGDIVTTAIDAFRRHDAHGGHRSSGQRTADAVVAMASAALRAGEAPTQHGVRPHIRVTVAWETVLADAGVAYTSAGDPVPYSHIRRLLADCGVARLIVDAANVPVEAGIDVRTVPAGLHKVLITREPTCAGDGCDVPHRFCDVMHLVVPFRLQGRLSPATSAFGCRFHHDKLDRGGWKMTWIDDRPVVHPPARPPRSSRSSPTGERPEASLLAEDTRTPTARTPTAPTPTAQPPTSARADPEKLAVAAPVTEPSSSGPREASGPTSVDRQSLPAAERPPPRKPAALAAQRSEPVNRGVSGTDGGRRCVEQISFDAAADARSP